MWKPNIRYSNDLETHPAKVTFLLKRQKDSRLSSTLGIWFPHVWNNVSEMQVGVTGEKVADKHVEFTGDDVDQDSVLNLNHL